MKKLISLLLAMIMVFSLATVAFATVDLEEPDDGAEGDTCTASSAEECTTENCPIHASTDPDGSEGNGNGGNQTEKIAATKPDNMTISLKKVYTVTGATADTVFPREVLSFTSTAATGNPDTENLTIDKLYVDGKDDQTITIHLPSYDVAGVYNYTIKETKGSTQAVGYCETAEIALKVLVTYDYEDADNDGYTMESKVVLNTAENSELDEDGKPTEGNDGKVDTFTNTYDVGTLTVTKTITGNLASYDQEFTMTVVFNSANIVLSDITVTGETRGDNATLKTNGVKGGDVNAPTEEGATEDVITLGDWTKNTDGTYTVTKTIKLKATDMLTFSNIPKDVTYIVKESADHLQLDETLDANNTAVDYTVKYTGGDTNTNNETKSDMDDSNAAGTIASNATDAVSVENKKETDVSTGIALDSAPYFLILAVAVVGMVALVSKKRYEV